MTCVCVRSCIQSKRINILRFFSPSGSHTILVFPYQTAWQYSDGNPLNRGVECRWGRQQLQFWAYIWLHCMLLTLQLSRCYKYGAAGPWFHKLWHLSQVVSGGACWWQETKTKCLWQEVSALCQRQQNTRLIARSDKSVAYVTNNKSLCSTFCTIEANYWQTRSISRPLCDSRATCSIPNIAAIFRRGPPNWASNAG